MPGSSVIGALRVDMSLGTAEFEEGAKKAQQKAKKAASGIQSAFSGLKRLFTPFNIGVASAVASLSALTLGIKDNIEHFDKLIKTARQIGLPVKEFSALTFAADQSGISMEELARGMRNVARNVAGGSTQFVGALQAIGLSLDEFANLSQQERLLLLADKFSVLKESGNKTALAMRLVGEEMGPRFINLLNNGRKGLIDYIAEADRLGVTIDEKTAVAAERFNDNMDRLSRSTTSLARTIAETIIPALADFSDGVLGIVRDLKSAETATDSLAVSVTRTGRFLDRLRLIITGSADDLDDYNRRANAALRMTDSILDRAREGRLSHPGGTIGDALPDLPGRNAQIDRRQDAPAMQTPEQIAAARKAEAEAARELLTAETALAQLRMEFATPEEERVLRLQRLRDQLSGLKEGTEEAAEAHRLYAMAAKRADADVTSAYASMASGVVGSLSQIFTKSKGFAIAQAVIDSYAAFNRALANPPGPPFSYAQAVAALASGFAKVRAISSAKPGTSGGGGGGTAGSGGGGAAPAVSRQIMNVNLHGGEVFSRDSIVRLIEQFNKATADGAILNARVV